MKSLIKMATLTALACVLAGMLAAPPVSAEISAECDEQGRFLRMIYRTNASVKNMRIWSVTRNERPNVFPLNPAGDDLMDSWPYHVENPYDGNRPYVVWGRFNGNDYDLVWSRWDDGGWTPVEWVERSMQSGVEQDAQMQPHPEDGRPHLVWWSDEDGIGRIYLSIFLNTRWMDRFLVSDLDTDSRYPVIEFLDHKRIMVTYDTVDGPVNRIIVFNSPSTITDDIDPMTLFGPELQKSNEDPGENTGTRSQT